MALQLPEWLNLPNFVAAMRSGAEAGIQARQQDREEASAGDRLRLAYEGLHEKERTAALQIQARQQQASDALAMRSAIVNSQLADRADARQQQAQHAADVLDATTRHYSDLAKHYAAQDAKTPREAAVTATIPADPNDPLLKPALRGPIGSPAIVSRQEEARKSAADALLKAQEPGWFSRTFLGKKSPVVPAKRYKYDGGKLVPIDQTPDDEEGSD